MAAPRAWGNSQTTKVSSCAVMILHALATQASSSPHLFPHPTFVTPPYPFSPSLVSILSVGKAVTHSLHLLHLTDNKDWIIKEVAFSLGVGECAQPKIPRTVRSTETRCSGPTEHHYHPQLFSAQTNALVTFGTSCP